MGGNVGGGYGGNPKTGGGMPQQQNPMQGAAGTMAGYNAMTQTGNTAKPPPPQNPMYAQQMAGRNQMMQQRMMQQMQMMQQRAPLGNQPPPVGSNTPGVPYDLSTPPPAPIAPPVPAASAPTPANPAAPNAPANTPGMADWSGRGTPQTGMPRAQQLAQMQSMMQGLGVRGQGIGGLGKGGGGYPQMQNAGVYTSPQSRMQSMMNAGQSMENRQPQLDQAYQDYQNQMGFQNQMRGGYGGMGNQGIAALRGMRGMGMSGMGMGDPNRGGYAAGGLVAPAAPVAAPAAPISWTAARPAAVATTGGLPTIVAPKPMPRVEQRFAVAAPIPVAKPVIVKRPVIQREILFMGGAGRGKRGDRGSGGGYTTSGGYGMGKSSARSGGLY